MRQTELHLMQGNAGVLSSSVFQVIDLVAEWAVNRNNRVRVRESEREIQLHSFRWVFLIEALWFQL